MFHLLIPNILYLLLPYYENYLYKPKNLNNNINNVVLYSYFFSSIHSLYISLLSFIFILDILDCQTYSYYTLNSIIYLGVDTYIVNYENQFKKIRKMFSFHHISVIILILFNYIDYLDSEYADTYLLSIALIGEICVIPLNISWFLYKINYKESLLYKINNRILILSYLLFRVIGYTYGLYIILYNQFTLAFIVGFPVIFMNYVWFCKLICLK